MSERGNVKVGEKRGWETRGRKIKKAGGGNSTFLHKVKSVETNADTQAPYWCKVGITAQFAPAVLKLKEKVSGKVSACLSLS